MDKEGLIKKITGVNIKDYSYAIIFFITFSFFVVAVIRPNLTTVFNLQKELESLEVIDKSYTGVIDKIISIQTAIETTREKIFVIDEALPATPQLNGLISNINEVAAATNIQINKLTVGKIDLKQAGQKKQASNVEINVETNSSFENLIKFITFFQDQRRLKSFTEIDVKKENNNESSDSAKLNIKLVIKGYYL